MAVSIFVNGVDLTVKHVLESLLIKNSGMQGIATCKVQFIDRPAGSTVSLEHILRVVDGSTEVFEGKIKTRGRKKTPEPGGPTAYKVYDVDAQDYTHLLTQDVIDTTLVRTGSRTDKAEAEFLITTYTSKGITVGSTVQSTGTISRDIDYSGMNLYEALEEASKWLGTGFYVDSDLQLHWFISEANAAPFNLSDSPNNTTTFGFRDLDLKDDSVDLVNAVWVIGTGITGFRTNATSIATYGRIETTLRDPDITTQAQLDAAGDGFLLDHAFPFEPIGLTTFKAGLKAGMTVQITDALWGLAAVTYRIVEVTSKYTQGTDQLEYDVRLDSKPIDLTDFFDRQQRQVIEAGTSATDAIGDIAGIQADLSVAGANLVKNSSFENGSAPDWTVGSQWVFGFDPTTPQEAFHGTDVARVVPTGTNTGELVTAGFIPIAKSDFYWFSVWSFIRARSAGAIKVVVREYDAASALLATTTLTASTVNTEWTRLTQRFGPNAQTPGTVIWNANTTKIKIAFFADGSPNLTWDVDGVQFERGKLITAYAPSPQELIDFQITATQIADDAVTTPKLIANAVVAGKVAVDAISANNLQAAAVTADKIAAGAVLVGALRDPISHLLVPNPSFEDTAGITVGSVSQPIRGWESQAYARVVNTPVDTGGFALELAGNGAIRDFKSDLSPVVPGRSIRFKARVRGNTGNNAASAVGMFIEWYDSAAAFLASTAVTTLVVGASTSYASLALPDTTVPSGAVYALFALRCGSATPAASEVYFDSVEGYYLDDDLTHAAGNVKIDATGILINQGKLTLKDEYGYSALAGAGVTGNLADFLSGGIYNGSFNQGTVGSLPNGRNSNLPYWTVAKTGGSVTATYATGEVDVVLAGAVSTSRRVELESDMVSVEPEAPYIARVLGEATVEAGVGVAIAAAINWYTAAGSFISQSVIAGVEPAPLSSGTDIPRAWYGGAAQYAPATARLASVTVMLYVSQSAASTSATTGKLFAGSLMRYTDAPMSIYYATSNLTLGTGYAVVPGLETVTLPNEAGGGRRYLIIATVDCSVGSAGVGEVDIQLVHGVFGTVGSSDSRLGIWQPASTVTGRSSITIFWIISTNAAQDPYQFAIRAKKTIAAGTATAIAAGSSMLVVPIA